MAFSTAFLSTFACTRAGLLWSVLVKALALPLTVTPAARRLVKITRYPDGTDNVAVLVSLS
ncbi:hypothetical protein D1872_191910 [compost metagenome]